MGFLLNIATLPPEEFWAWFTGLAAIALTGLFFTFRQLHRARIIEDTPTARIRSAPQGYVELEGMAAALPGEPIIAPLSHLPCCWYSYRIEKRGDNGWRTIRQGCSDGLFLLRDETGSCIIDPEGAEITPGDRQVWHGESSFPLAGPGGGPVAESGSRLAASLFTRHNSHLVFGPAYRYTEETLVPGDHLYALGEFHSLGESDYLAMREAKIRDRLRQWKMDYGDLLDRFDLNGDGQIDSQEWELARRAASREVGHEEQREPAIRQHTLRRPAEKRLPFLIATRPQFELARRYRRLALLAGAIFFLAGGLDAWLLARHLSN